jgi:hypothetical protein
MQLRDSIRHILSPHPAPSESTAFIDLTLQIASIHLLKRIKAGAINPAFFGLSPTILRSFLSLALGCDAYGSNAHLFTRDNAVWRRTRYSTGTV